MLNRREFIAAAGATAAGLALGCRTGAPAAGAAAGAGPADHLGPIGVGLFTLPKSLSQDFDGTLAMLAGLGYRELEFFGPYPFSPQAVQDGWKGVAASIGLPANASGFFGRTAREVRASLDRAGLVSPSTHVDLATLRSRTGELADAAHEVGWRYAGLAAIPEELRRTLDDYRRMADELNAIGARTKAMGFKVLYHNHGYGFTPLEGQIPARVLFDRLDPELVALEMDIFWTVAGGADPLELLDAYPKLYRLMHVKDMTKQARFSRGGDMQDWISLFPLMTTVGAGILDFPRILGHAKRNGVEHFYVEQDLAADPPAQLGASARYLKSLTLSA